MTGNALSRLMIKRLAGYLRHTLFVTTSWEAVAPVRRPDADARQVLSIHL